MSATGFSYAQAARGQIAPQVTATFASTTAALDAKEGVEFSSPAQSAVATAADAVKPAASESGSTSRKVDSDAGSATDSATLIGTLVESTSNISLDDASFQVASASDKIAVQMATATTRSSSTDDSARKARTTPKTKVPGKEEVAPAAAVAATAPVESGVEKEKEPVKVILSPAPVPTKNIWEERRRELAAKAKLSSPVAAGKPDVAAAVAGAKAKDSKKPNGLSAESETNGAETNGFVSAVASVKSQSQPQQPQPRRLSETTRPDPVRRSGPRGSRAVDKDVKTAANRSTLPPVQDATLWPTPDSAAMAVEARARTQAETTGDKPDRTESSDKDGQEDGAPTKSRKRGNWVTLPFVPSVNFETPMPNVRGSKAKTGGRGGRDASTRGGYNGVTNGATSTDKVSGAAAAASADKASADLANGSTAVTRSTPQSAGNPPKRFAVDAATHVRDARKPAGADAAADRFNESASDKGHGSTNGEVHGHHVSHSVSGRFSSVKSSSGGGEHHQQTLRDRTDVRGERPGRGGFRGGRGGHASSVSQGHHIPRSAYQPNGQRSSSNSGAAYTNGTSTLPPSAAPFSPSAQQFSFGGASSGANARTGRAAGRAQSMSQVPAFTNRGQNGVAGSGRGAHAHSLHLTDMPAEFQMQQQQQQAYPVAPFPLMENEHFMVLAKQVEYYFSLENLCKDMFLRKKMDGQGFVPLSVVAGFRRMAELAPSIDFIRAACEQSEKLDYIIDKEQKELIRSRHEWRKFVLPAEQRNEEARGSGPDMRTVQFQSLHSRPPQAYYAGMFAPGYSSAGAGMYPGAPVFAMNGGEMGYADYENGVAGGEPAPTNDTGTNGVQTNGKPLSAAVPDFSPTSTGAPLTLEDYQNCPDEQVEKLVVVVASEADAASAGPNGSHSAVDKPSGINGVSPLEAVQDLPGAMTTTSTTTTTMTVEKPYAELRARALEQREAARAGETPTDMKHLYRFWSHCLPDKFNVRMYQDFRSSALDDARSAPASDFGLRQLVRYYNHVLLDPAGTRPFPAVFVPHFGEAKELLNGKKSDEARA